MEKSSRFSLWLVIGVAGLWLVGTWLLSTPLLNAAEGPPPLLTFDSPIGNPELAIRKTVDSTAPKPGDEVVYTLTYSSTNPGSQAFNVRIYDFLPPGVDLISSTPPGTYSEGALTFTAPSVTPAESSIIIRARVRRGYDHLHNSTLLMADGVTPAYDTNTIPVTPLNPSLRLVHNGPAAVLIDREILYTLRGQNNGEIVLENVTLASVLPAGVSFDGASIPPDTANTPFIQWNVGTLDIGEIWEVTITATAPSYAGLITNTALADAEEIVVRNNLWPTEVITQGAILQVDKRASTTTVEVDNQLVYTLNFHNSGNLTATNAILTDTFPSGITVESVTPMADIQNTTMAVWNLGDLGPDEMGQAVITATVGGEPERTLTNRAEINGDNSFMGYDETDTYVRITTRFIYLPLMMRN